MPLQLKLLSMDEEERKKLKYRYQYLNLSYKIMQFRMNGQNPPMDLIDHAIEIGRLAKIPDEELCSL
jgi:hypothetical protein